MLRPHSAPGTTLLSAASSIEPCDSRDQAIRDDRKIADWLTSKSARTNVELAPSPKTQSRTNVETAPKFKKKALSSARVISAKLSQLILRKWTKLTNLKDQLDSDPVEAYIAVELEVTLCQYEMRVICDVSSSLLRTSSLKFYKDLIKIYIMIKNVLNYLPFARGLTFWIQLTNL